jgi:hypothetical protein
MVHFAISLAVHLSVYSIADPQEFKLLIRACFAIFCYEKLPSLPSLQFHLQQDHSTFVSLHLFVKVEAGVLSYITFVGVEWSEAPNLEETSSNVSVPSQDPEGVMKMDLT